MKRSQVYALGKSNFRVINAFIINSNGEIWIPRRSADKRIYPLCLDMSMGGHVESGETYDQAFKREAREELNINFDNFEYQELGRLSPQKNMVSANMRVYEIKMESTPNYNKNDFIESYWLTPKAVLNKISNGDKSKGDLPILINYFYGNKKPLA